MDWTEITGKYSVDEMLDIIEDASMYGFEFKVENHKLFYREEV